MQPLHFDRSHFMTRLWEKLLAYWVACKHPGYKDVHKYALYLPGELGEYNSFHLANPSLTEPNRITMY